MPSSRPTNDYSRVPTLDQAYAVIDASPVPTVVLQWNKIVHLNPSCRALLGNEAEQLIYRHVLGLSELVESEEAERRKIHRLLDGCEQIPVPKKNWISRNGKWQRQEGGVLILETRAWRVPLAGGNGIQLTLSDITGRRRHEEDHTIVQEQLRLAIEAAEVGTWNFDPLTDKLRGSNEFSEIFDLPWNKEIEYPSFLTRLHPEDRTRTDNAMQQSFDPNGSGEFGCDCRVLCPEGDVRWVALKGHAFFAKVDGRRQAVRLVGTALDITNLRQTDASLRQTEKLAATGRLAAAIAHEINNPLESITNLLYLLEDSPLQEEQKKYLKLAQQELARVVDIATQTLRFYRDPSSPQQCNLVEVLESVLTLFGGRMTASHIQIQRRYLSQASIVCAREELRQVFVNLIHNAIDAMSHGGKLLVRTKETLDLHNGRRGIRLTIADTGHGMDRATKKRIFEPFFTTKVAVGVGLGLWLSAGVIEQHGGTIQVKSRRRPGQSGTVFSIFLPLDRRR